MVKSTAETEMAVGSCLINVTTWNQMSKTKVPMEIRKSPVLDHPSLAILPIAATAEAGIYHLFLMVFSYYYSCWSQVPYCHVLLVTIKPIFFPAINPFTSQQIRKKSWLSITRNKSQDQITYLLTRFMY